MDGFIYATMLPSGTSRLASVHPAARRLVDRVDQLLSPLAQDADGRHHAALAVNEMTRAVSSLRGMIEREPRATHSAWKAKVGWGRVRLALITFFR
jgi:hypothetical protein